MDAAVRMSALALLLVPVTITLLIPHDVWLVVPFLCFSFAWLSYRAAVAAAKRFSLGLSVMFDLHHLRVWDGLALPRPGHLLEERARAQELSKLLGNDPLDDVDRAPFVYQPQGPQR